MSKPVLVNTGVNPTSLAPLSVSTNTVIMQAVTTTTQVAAGVVRAWLAPSNGTLIVSFGIPSGSTASCPLIVRGPTVLSYTSAIKNALALNGGNTVAAGSEYDVSIPVVAGEFINFTVSVNTTLQLLNVLFVEGEIVQI